MRVTFADGSAVDAQEEAFAEGAEGSLHACDDGRFVIKRYFQPDVLRKPRVEKIIAYWPDIQRAMTLNFGGRHYVYLWPLQFGVTDHGGGCVLMSRKEARFRPLQDLLMSGPGEGVNHLIRLLVGLNIARAARPLHQNGLAHSDFSFKNFECDVATGQIAVMDLDGLVVPDWSVMKAQMLGTPMCVAPELLMGLATPTIDSDKHALAVLIYWALLFRHPLRGRKFHDADPHRDDYLSQGERALYSEHPHDESNRPDGVYVPSSLLAPELGKLFQRAFVDGLHGPSAPRQRPHASEWETQLWWAIEQLCTCANDTCGQRYFVLPPSRPFSCPWCVTPAKGCFAIVSFYREVRKGTWAPNKVRVMRGHGQALFGYHLAGRPPEPQDDVATELVRFHVVRGAAGPMMMLENAAVEDLLFAPIEPSGAERKIGIGERVSIGKQSRLKLGLTAAHVALVSA